MAKPVDDPSTLNLEVQAPPPEAGAARVSIVFYYREGVALLELREGCALVVGRSFPSDLVIADPSLSRLHARFLWSEGKLSVKDLDSTNGTRVAGQLVHEAEVRSGDELVLGQVIGAVHLMTGPQGARPGVESYERLRERLREELERAQAFKRSFCVAMLRSVSVPAGRLAPALRRLSRPVDAVGIHDGRALLLVLPELSLAEAQQHCAELARQLPDPQTIAIGLASFPESAASEEGLVAHCHEACRDAAPGSAPRVHAEAAQAPPVSSRPVLKEPSMRALHQTLRQVAPRSMPVLITGETGVGKEVIARLLHEASLRRGPLRTINCATISASLLESTLFGHERGAFTGALKRASGLFEDAEGGTVFLDEIGELSLAAQASLLRVVQEKRILRVGSTREIPVDVRIVTATHRDLAGMVEQGSFRQDLLYRLNTVVLEVPPLRERTSEIAALAQHFLDDARAQWQGSARRISAQALALLQAHHWPGNVRELRNVIERAVALCDRESIEPIDLPASLRDMALAPRELAAPPSLPAPPAEAGALDDALFRDRVRDYELGLIRDALEKANGNAPRAAELLRIPVRTLAYKMKAYGIRES